MYGDCQVMSTLRGDVVSSETLFSSAPIQNPSFNFMPFQPFPSMIAVSFLYCIYSFPFPWHKWHRKTNTYWLSRKFPAERRERTAERKGWDGSEWVWEWTSWRKVGERARESWTASQEETLPQAHRSADPRNGSVLSLSFLSYSQKIFLQTSQLALMSDIQFSVINVWSSTIQFV